MGEERGERESDSQIGHISPSSYHSPLFSPACRVFLLPLISSLSSEIPFSSVLSQSVSLNPSLSGVNLHTHHFLSLSPQLIHRCAVITRQLIGPDYGSLVDSNRQPQEYLPSFRLLIVCSLTISCNATACPHKTVHSS